MDQVPQSLGDVGRLKDDLPSQRMTDHEQAHEIRHVSCIWNPLQSAHGGADRVLRVTPTLDQSIEEIRGDLVCLSKPGLHQFEHPHP